MNILEQCGTYILEHLEPSACAVLLCARQPGECLETAGRSQRQCRRGKDSVLHRDISRCFHHVDAWNEVQAHHIWLSEFHQFFQCFFHSIAKALVTGAFWHFSADLLYPVVHIQFVLFLMALLGTQFCTIR